MNCYRYHTTSNKLLVQLDKTFRVVSVIGFPEHGNTEGYDLEIYDTRSKSAIKAEIRNLYNDTRRTV